MAAKERKYLVFRKSGDKTFTLLAEVEARNKRVLARKLKKMNITGKVLVVSRISELEVK